MAVILLQLMALALASASNALTISNVRVTNINSNAATIEWDTDVIANGKVQYGKTSGLGYSQKHDNFVDKHIVTVSNGIASETIYYFSVESSDAIGNSAAANNSDKFFTFKTPDITPPPIVTGLRISSSTQSSISLAWDSSSAADISHYIIYRNNIRIANSTAAGFNDTSAQPGAAFTYRVAAVDSSGNEGLKSDSLSASAASIDMNAPAITNVNVLTVTDTTAIIKWLTNENSTSIVAFGINDTGKMQTSSGIATNHSVSIEGLIKGQSYVFIVKSCDASGNCANSSVKSFIAGKDIMPPFINLTIPRYISRRVIDLTGSTEPSSSIALFINDMNVPKRSLSGSETSSGKFAFSQIQLEPNNAIKVVAIDSSGNRNEKLIEVGVDTEEPAISLNNVTALTSNSNVTISGTVNEQVAISIFVDINVNDSSVPQKIFGLNATKITQNSIEIHWQELREKDFSNYAVYRSGIPIAVTKPSSYNLFIDASVDSGKSYTYSVSAVNIFGKEGQKSDPLTAATPGGGEVFNRRVEPVDIFEELSKPLLALNASGAFNFGVKLGKGDGNYKIRLLFEDKAKNSVLIERSISLDTKKPEVKITNPGPGAFVYENAANQVDIIGTTKPNSKVHLYIDRTPFTFYEQSFEVSGLPNEIQDIPESISKKAYIVDLTNMEKRLENVSDKLLEAKCKLGVVTNACRDGADRSVMSDSKGNFKFEGVDLTATFGAAARFTEVRETEIRDIQLNQEAANAKRTTLVVVAVDQAGLKGFASQTVGIGTCWRGNQSWDVIPLTNLQSPFLLSTERLAEGTEAIRFYFNFSYIGRGAKARIKIVAISKACSSYELSDPRFNLSCKILQAGGNPKYLNPPDNTLTYTEIPLGRLPNMDKFAEGDWKGFLKSISKEMTFPIKLQISYQHDMNNDGILETEVQQTCEQLTYVVDNSIIDPRKVLPDFMLYDFVDFLDTSIKGLSKAQEQIDRALNYVAYGCLSSFALNTVLQTYRRWVEFWDEHTYNGLLKGPKGLLGTDIFTTNPFTGPEQADCQILIEEIVKSKGKFKIKYMTDADLARCFPRTSGAWKREADSYQWFRWTCDRIFGHAAPAKRTEVMTDKNLREQIDAPDQCPGQSADRGKPIRLVRCKDVQLSKYEKQPSQYEPDAKCFEISDKNTRSTTLYVLNERPIEGNLYKISRSAGRSTIEEDYALKITETNYLTADPRSCSEVCAGPGQTQRRQVQREGKSITINYDKSGNAGWGECLIVNTCRALNAGDQKDPNNPSSKITITEMKDGKPLIRTVSDASTRGGFTSDCFYGRTYAYGGISSDTKAVLGTDDEREVCCCINSKEKSATDYGYYQPDDVWAIDTSLRKPVHQSKTASPLQGALAATPPQGSVQAPDAKEDQRLADMKWSYRYFKEKFEAKSIDNKAIHNQYNKDRYIEGRDLPACFGQNNWLRGDKALFVDPFKQHEASVQCVHLAGVSQRLKFLQNLMGSMSTCLKKVRISGGGDAGACKELFTQYLCNSIWQIVNFATNGCNPTEFPETEKQNTNVLTYVKQGFKGVSESLSDLQSTITQEYGNAKLNELLGTGESSVARKICLAAFGYDWEINAKNLVDVAYATPFSTLVQPITKSREFLTVDPLSYRPKYEYRASWIINPGCDFERYDVYLSCIGRKQLDQYPNQINCGAVGAPSIGTVTSLGVSTSKGYSDCDCLNLPDEKVQPFFGGRLKQNVLEDREHHDDFEYDVRYDHLKFVLKTDRRIPPNTKANCFPSGYEDGVFYFPLHDKTIRDIADCRVDPLSGSFTCGASSVFTTKKGFASFVDLFINGVNTLERDRLVFNVGDSLVIDTNIRKVGADKCLSATIDNHEEVMGIDVDGVYPYQMVLGTTLSTIQPADIQAPKEITVSKLPSSNPNPVSIKILFYDADNDGWISFAPDSAGNKDGSKDVIEIESNQIPISSLTAPKILNKGTNNEVEVSLSDYKIVLKKQKAEIEILAAVIPKDLAGKAQATKKITDASGKAIDVGVVDANIVVSGTTTAAQPPQSQVKTLVIGLYHLKGDAEKFTNAGDCDLNNPVYGSQQTEQKRTIMITVQQRPTGAETQGPSIRNLKIPGTVQKEKTGEIRITAEITHASGIKSAVMACKKPDGNDLPVPLPNSLSNNLYDFVIGINSINMAGKYQCTITATAQNPAAKTNSYTASFEVMCGGPPSDYGFCEEDKCMLGSTKINGGLQCAPKKVAPTPLTPSAGAAPAGTIPTAAPPPS